MPAKRLSMRKIKEVLRLKHEKKLSNRQIAKICNISRPTVSDYLRRFQVAKISYPLSEDVSDTKLEQLLFPPQNTLPPSDARKAPDWEYIHKELKRPGVTLDLLWQEYREGDSKGYQYSWFCDQYRQWQGKLDLVMRQNHLAGEKLFVDYAGHTVPIADKTTGEVRKAQIFVGVMGASNYTYAEATYTQSLPDWIDSHIRCFSYLGGVPQIVVPDNLRSAVTKAHLYEPDLNPTYQDMATHYGVAIIPARVRKPQDKAKAEVGVQIVERMILAVLRNHTFFSLGQLNSEILKLLDKLNRRAFKKLPSNRLEQFESIDLPALLPLPVKPYSYAQWKKVRVNIDYHIEVEGHYYSAPYTLVKKQLDARISQNTIELFHKGQRVASHHRSYLKGHHSTQTNHMPKSHQKYEQWTPQRLSSWAAKSGVATQQLTLKVLSSRKHPQQGYRSCLGILRLGESYGAQRLEKACQRALLFETYSYKSIASILKHKLDQRDIDQEIDEASDKNVDTNLQQDISINDNHDNIRGANYYT